jgi:hypothetical protein
MKAPLVCSVPLPELTELSANHHHPEIGTDMSQFSNSKRLCCLGGSNPMHTTNLIGKRKSVRITRAGIYLIPALLQVAHASREIGQCSLLQKSSLERFCKRRDKIRAIIAIARMILTAI